MNFLTTGETREQLLERPLPHSAEAERAIIGAILLDPSQIARAVVVLKPEHMYVRAHTFVYTCMMLLAERGDPIDPLTLSEELRRQGVLEQVGGMTFVSEITTGLPHYANIFAHAKIVRDYATVRDMIKVANKITGEGLDYEDDADTLLDKAAAYIEALRHERRTGGGGSSVRTMQQIFSSLNAEFGRWKAGHTSSLATGIPELDERLKLKGFAPGELIYIAAPPSRGKTALALQIAIFQAKVGIAKPLIFSIEMSGEALGMRVLAGEARVPHYRFRPDLFEHPDEVAKIAGVFQRVSEYPVLVDDRTRNLGRLCALARSYVENEGVTEILVDYAQLVESGLKGQQREREVAHISSTLKGLASDLRVPVIATSQLRKAGGNQDANRRPELEDLRDSYQLAQDADLVLTPYGALTDADTRPMKLYCPKQRNGRVGWELDIDFKGDWQLFFSEQMYRYEFEEEERRNGNGHVPEEAPMFREEIEAQQAAAPVEQPVRDPHENED
jgi:replicative DNA helicase